MIIFLIPILFYLIKRKIKLYRVKNLQVNKLFVLLCTFFGLFSSVLIPLYQVPDEYTHINMIYSERNLNITFKSVNSNYNGVAGIIGNKRIKVNRKEYFDFSKRINNYQIFSIPNIFIIRHFPQYFGMIIGELFHFPTFFYITFCELLALLFYIIFCNIALKLFPIKKFLFLLIILLPICVQQMSSFSYDCILNSMCFLFISYIFYLKYNNIRINLSDVIIMLLLLIIIGLCKIPYVLLGGLIFILDDVKKFSSKYIFVKKNILLIVLIFLIFICLLPYLSFLRIIAASMLNYKKTFFLIVETFVMYFKEYYSSTTYILGWFDLRLTPVLGVGIGLMIIFYLITNYQKENKNEYESFNIEDKLIVYLVIIVLIFSIFLSMIEWMGFADKLNDFNSYSLIAYKRYISSLRYIGGVQGRYFIPIIPLFIVLFKSRKYVNSFIYYAITLSYYIFYFIIFIYSVLNRYWI